VNTSPVFIYICVCVCACVCIYVCMRVCMHVCVCVYECDMYLCTCPLGWSAVLSV
jgi:hypothetical protein